MRGSGMPSNSSDMNPTKEIVKRRVKEINMQLIELVTNNWYQREEIKNEYKNLVKISMSILLKNAVPGLRHAQD